MKKFEAPELEVITFAAEDIITTSPVNGGGLGEDDTPIG